MIHRLLLLLLIMMNMMNEVTSWVGLEASDNPETILNLN
jgi:hypothetical protein